MPVPRKQRKRVTSVEATLPQSIELTKRKSQNSMQFRIRTGDELLGTLVMGRGTVEWWPRGNKSNRMRKDWRSFANMLDKSMN